jgi:Ca2+-binding EF-hand superfamily protein
MKHTALATAILLAGAGTAMAEDMLDANADGMITLDELLAVYTDVTEEQFIQADANGDGVLDADELAAA